MSKSTSQFDCTDCGTSHSKWQGRCRGCGVWNTLVEGAAAAPPAAAQNRYASWAGASGAIQTLDDVATESVDRLDTGLAEFNRVLGGGLAASSVTLLGGEPGVGKSTLLIQALVFMAERAPVLYITGEESKQQVALRARRLGLSGQRVRILAETHLESILAAIDTEKARVCVVDSIQTLHSGQLQAAPGSVSQVRECAAQLTRLAKSRSGVSILLVGHVNKDGELAGPRVLEHIVDTSLSFECEPGSHYRMVRAVKNRFGAANELGVFQMSESGLSEVANPSSMFLTAHDKPVPGSAVLSAMEGNRSFLVEVQALVEETPSSNPKRQAGGIDAGRLQMLLAVLNRHASMPSFDQNVYLKVAGGVRVTEPAADLAVLLAVHSSLTGRPVPLGTVAFGEVGLVGEVRPVQHAEQRLREAAKLGFTRAIIPNACDIKRPVPGIETIPVSRVAQVISALRELKSAA